MSQLTLQTETTKMFFTAPFIIGYRMIICLGRIVAAYSISTDKIALRFVRSDFYFMMFLIF